MSYEMVNMNPVKHSFVLFKALFLILFVYKTIKREGVKFCNLVDVQIFKEKGLRYMCVSQLLEKWGFSVTVMLTTTSLITTIDKNVI